MSSNAFLIGIMSFAMLNGLFSPSLVLALPFMLVFYPPFMPSTPGVILMSTSLLVSTLTLMFAGVPAAIYERVAGATASTSTSLWIWLTCTALLSLPAVVNAVGAL